MKYSGWETAYDEHNSSTLWQDDPIPIMAEAIAVLRNHDVETVVDVGCGDGRNVVALKEAGFNVAGIDISATALIRAHERLAERKMRAFLVTGEATNMPMPDATVDALTIFDVFGQFEEPADAVAEFERVLVPGGLVILNAFNTDDGEYGVGEPIGEHAFLYKDTLFRYFTEESIRGLFCGFAVQSVTTQSWIDPPHGDFRPYEHRHENWVVIAQKPRK